MPKPRLSQAFCSPGRSPIAEAWPVQALLCWLLLAALLASAPAASAPAPAAPALLRDDFSAPFGPQQALDPARWSAYDSSYAYGRTRFGNLPSIVSEGETTFARLPVSTYSGDASFPFRGTEIFSSPFDLGVGKEMEARVRVTNLPPGLVAAFWAYGSQGDYGTPGFHSDEIDIEFLSRQPHDSLLLTNWNDWDPSSPSYNDGVHHSGLAVGTPGLDWAQWNVYKIRWLPDRTQWYVNGSLIQSLAPAHPDGPLAVRFNAWAPDSSFQAAYDPSLAPASSAGASASYSYDVDWVEVRAIVPTLALSLAPGSWSEAAGAQASTASVTRNTDISAPLTVSLSSSGPSSVPAQVVIPAGAASASFAVAATDDQIAQGSRGQSFNASAAGFVSGTASALVTDDDVAGIVLGGASGLRTAENGASAAYTVQLSSQPIGTVRLDLSSSRAGEGIASPASLLFTPQNWSLPQSVAVTGQDDFSADGDQPYAIALSARASEDAVYKQLGPAFANVVNADDDRAGIAVAAAPSLQTSEAGRTSTFTIRLTSQPGAPVALRLASSNSAEGSASPTSLSFSALDWSIPKTVIVIGANDDVADGNRAYQILTLPSASADAAYNGLDAEDVSLVNVDDDTASVLVAPALGLVTTESGGSASFTVRLGSQPTADVVIPISSSNAGEGTVLPASLLFNASNWAIAQAVTVKGADDDVADGDQPYSIVTGAPLSMDAGYGSMDAASVPDVQVLNRDNDAASVIISPLSGLSTSESGQAASFSVVLGSQPTARVAIGFSSSAPSEGIASPQALIFTPSNWSQAQKVTVTGVDDAIADGDQAYAVAAWASSEDRAYQVLALPSIALANIDNDAAALALSLSTSIVSEGAGGRAAMGTVTRNTPLGAALAVELSSSETGAATVPALVTIPSGSASASFEVSAVDDDALDGPQSSVIRARAAGLAEATATLTVTDDDVAPTPTAAPTSTPTAAPTSTPAPTPEPVLSLSLSASTLDENAMSQADRPASRGRVALSAPAPAALVVRLSSSDQSELQVPASVAIAAGQSWAEFVLWPVDDVVADGTRRVTVTASAQGYAPRSSAVDVRDDEVPTLSASIAPGRVAEGGWATMLIRRNIEVSASTPPLSVSLGVSRAGQAMAPALVLIPARSSWVSVRLKAVDNAVADGPRRLAFSARAPGWATGSAALTVQDNEAASRLSLAGRVTMAPAQNSLPLGGVTLTLLSGASGASVVDLTTSASDGSYVFRGLPPGSYRVLAAREGVALAPSSRGATLSTSSLRGLDFVASVRGQISGRAQGLNADGTFSSLANVAVTARGAGLSWIARTDRGGRFLFDRLPVGLPGLFEVTPALANTAFSPRSRSVRLTPSLSTASGLLFTSASSTARDAHSAGSAQASPLVLSSALAQCAASTIVLRFSGPLDARHATHSTSYKVLVNGAAQQAEAAHCQADTVTLAFAEGALRAGDWVQCFWPGLRDARQRRIVGQATITAVTR